MAWGCFLALTFQPPLLCCIAGLLSVLTGALITFGPSRNPWGKIVLWAVILLGWFATTFLLVAWISVVGGLDHPEGAWALILLLLVL